MPIGFFSPLPLAMMIPFMATQSLAMGEAFGKSFQYGKRKISSMSNEEFNKYTITDMMSEQTADIRTLIPKLTEQMSMSSIMQKQIFQEMIKLVPTFVNAISQAVTGNEDKGQPGIANLFPSAFGEEATPDPSGTGQLDPNAQYYLNQNAGFQTPSPDVSQKYNQSIFRAMSLNELIKGINSGRFTGSDLSLARHTLSTRQQTDQTLIPTIATSQQKQHQTWLSNKNSFLQQFINWKSVLARTPVRGNNDRQTAINQKQIAEAKSQLITVKSKIRKMSNDYRNPNNAIRRDVIILRQQISKGLLK